jgi:hypothetical protein
MQSVKEYLRSNVKESTRELQRLCAVALVVPARVQGTRI